MQMHPDGSADIVQHRVNALDHGITWVSRMPDQQALGLEAGTAGVEGFSMEKEKGNVRYIEGGQRFYCEIRAGYMSATEAVLEKEKIDRIAGRAKG
jgi:hypothetical protein